MGKKGGKPLPVSLNGIICLRSEMAANGGGVAKNADSGNHTDDGNLNCNDNRNKRGHGGCDDAHTD